MSQSSFLLDTHILLEALLAPHKLPLIIQTDLMNPNNTIWFSVASIWEIAIKASLGRGDFGFNSGEIHLLALETGFTELPILSDHCHLVTNLPLQHKDPFDRLLVAQCEVLSTTLLTRDRALPQYSPKIQLLI